MIVLEYAMVRISLYLNVFFAHFIVTKGDLWTFNYQGSFNSLSSLIKGLPMHLALRSHWIYWKSLNRSSGNN